MKDSLLQKVGGRMFFGLTLSILLCLGISTQAQAREEERIGILGETDGILQGGGLLTENQGQSRGILPYGLPGTRSILPRGAGANEKGAEKALEKGVKGFQSKISFSAYHITIYEFHSLFNDFLNGHPELFYLSHCSYSYIPGENQVIEVYPAYTDKIETVKAQAKTYEKKIKEIVASVPSSWSNLEKALYVNDYLDLNCAYDFTYQKYNAYHALIEGKAVCQGYALAYLDLMNRLDVPCELVTSRKLNHAWNLVKVGRSWYHVDTTWNDATPDQYGRACHTYFLKSTSWFRAPFGANVTAHDAADYVYSGSAKDKQASDKTFDKSFWDSVNRPFCYHAGYWYGNTDGTIVQYRGSNAGLKKIKNMKKLNYKWYMWGSSSYYYTGDYSGCCIVNGRLYFATPDSIRSFSLTYPKGQVDTAYKLTEAEKKQGRLYGFYITKDWILKYQIAKGPSAAAIQKERRIQLKATADDKQSGHTHSFWSWKVTKASSCAKTGIETRTCACGYRETRSTPKTSHQHTVTVTTQKATFLQKGTTKTVCQDCKKTVKTGSLAKVKCKKGTVYVVGNDQYQILSPKLDGTGTVCFTGLKKNVKKVAIKDTVTILGVKFKITKIGSGALRNKTSVTSVTIGKHVSSIGKEAFLGAKKLKNITIRSQKLKKVGVSAFKGIHARAKIQVPKSMLSKYRNLLNKKGQKKTVKIVS